MSAGLKPPESANDEQIIQIDQFPSPEKEAEIEFSTPEQREKHLNNKSLEQDIKERKRYAIFAFRITKTWVCFIITITILQIAARLFERGLHDAEFIAVLTTTTGSVFGFWWLVGQYLFKAKESQSNLKMKKMLDK